MESNSNSESLTQESYITIQFFLFIFGGRKSMNSTGSFQGRTESQWMSLASCMALPQLYELPEASNVQLSKRNIFYYLHSQKENF